MHIFTDHLQKENILTRTDPRIKLVAALFVLAMILSSNGILFPFIITAVCLVICIRLKLPLRVLLVRFSEPLFIAAVLLLLKLFFSGKVPFFSIDIAGVSITGYYDGLMDGLRLSSRIIGAVSLIAVVGFVTPFTDIIAGLSWFRIPAQFIELLMLAYRYIFVLFEDAGIIYNAQKNRLGYSGIRRGLSSFGTLTGELTLRAFDRSQKIALAMAQRGYTGNIPIAAGSSFRKSEIVFATISVAAISVIWKIL